ncbi:MAG: type II secretion system protein GspL [Gammaproteobacteria bacterium]|nr:MAG: type II secretion system protein GspL [Gammaproteobacteria bacterium]TLY88510.1 MAG: type II secretion system protein GspL [Gammaproteobacteria bacterium]
MADWLLLRLPRAAGEPASWLIADAGGAPAGPPQSGPLTLAAARAAGRRVCALVPGADVLLAEPEIPVKAGAKLQQLVPYALEEQLADDIDDLHFAIGKRAGDSSHAPVAVVARALLDEWLTTLRTSGLEPEAIYADSELLPQNPGQAVVLLEEDAVLVRSPGACPVTLPADALAEALDIAHSGAERSASGARGLILYAGAAEWQRHSAQIEAARARFDGIKVQLLTGGPLALFAQQLPAATPINLLQGSYAPTAARAVGLRAWRVAAILLLSLISLHLVGKIGELQLLKNRERQLDASIRDTFHAAMPGDPNTLDARRRMEQRLNAARGAGGGLLPALQALAQARDAVPGMSVQALQFHGGALDMKLSAPDAASLDRVSQALRNSGWQADLTGGSNAPSGYEGHIQVRAGGT